MLYDTKEIPGQLSLLLCPCRVFSRIKTLTGGALIYVNDQSGTSDALAAAGSMSAPGFSEHCATTINWSLLTQSAALRHLALAAAIASSDVLMKKRPLHIRD